MTVRLVHVIVAGVVGWTAFRNPLPFNELVYQTNRLFNLGLTFNNGYLFYMYLFGFGSAVLTLYLLERVAQPKTAERSKLGDPQQRKQDAKAAAAMRDAEKEYKDAITELSALRATTIAHENILDRTMARRRPGDPEDHVGAL